MASVLGGVSIAWGIYFVVGYLSPWGSASVRHAESSALKDLGARSSVGVR